MKNSPFHSNKHLKAAALVLGVGISSASFSQAVSVPLIHIFESDANGFNTKTYFIEGQEEVTAIDAQFTPALAEQAIAFLKTKTQKPISYLVVTHPNPDKFNGAGVFQRAGAQVVMSKATAAALPSVHEYKKYFFVKIAKMFTEDQYPPLATADIRFEGEMLLKFGPDTLKIKELKNAGVSTTQTVVISDSNKSIFVGDLIHSLVHAWLEGGIVGGQATPNIKGWIQALKELSTVAGPKSSLYSVYGGRGNSAELKPAVQKQIRYLKKAEKIVKKYITKLGNRKTELAGEKASEHHAAITKEFEKEFPAYGLSYMIQYGVYGLVNSLNK
jgi:glyoxylase-like metal-dependent hydrolase (beta-lactamase superfamily II)